MRGASNMESTRMHAAALAAQMNMPMPLRRCRCRHSVCRSRGAADSQLSPPKNNHPGGWLFFCVGAYAPHEKRQRLIRRGKLAVFPHWGRLERGDAKGIIP